MTAAFRQPRVNAEPDLPLTMPDQSFDAPFSDPAAVGIRPPGKLRAVRIAVLTLPLCVTLGFGWIGLGWFTVDGYLAAHEATLVAVTVFAFYWVVLSVATSALGLFWRPQPPVQSLHGLSVAILLPMYGEPAAPTIGNALALLAALSGKGRHSFSLYVLSDTRDPTAAQAEVAAMKAARYANPGLALHYRQRTTNTDYKSGNIREWVTTRGQYHDAMLILDADSVMGAASVQLMADRMAVEPGLGLIQTVPRVLEGHTVWQRMQSFASEVYGTNLGRGFALWTGSEGNFLGHNALLRTRAFAVSAGLPHLTGRAPRGGVILSHDFVEAALIRRAGWGVQMLPEASESYEATPETLPGYLRRDRRWCQGNMQHLRLLATPGLHIVSRFHLLQGAMAYLASVWWLVLLALWAFSGQGGTRPDPFLASRMIPVLQEPPLISQAVLTATVAIMLLGPKILGIAAHLRDRGIRLGQLPGFATSVLVEVVLSVVLAPALMVHQVRAVLRTLAGFDGGWMPHLAGRPRFATLSRFHLTETMVGAALLCLCAMGQINFWLLPIAGCLVLTSLLSWLVQLDIQSAWLFRPMEGDPMRLMVSVLILILMAGGAWADCGPDKGACTIADGAYHIVLPDEVARPIPAIILLHGYGGEGLGTIHNKPMVNLMLGRGYAVIAPDGQPRHNGKGRSWDFHPDRAATRDETAFLIAVADDASARFGLQRGKMLLAGFSIGASMTSYVACAKPDAFAAYAPVAGSFWRPLPEACVGPVRLFHTHGKADRTVPLEGREIRPGFAQGNVFDAMQIWRKANGCPAANPDAIRNLGILQDRGLDPLRPGDEPQLRPA